jgi:S1-C subfamily serine protease
MTRVLQKGANTPLADTRPRAGILTGATVNPGRIALALLPIGGADVPCLPLQGDVAPYVDPPNGHPLDIPLILDALSPMTQSVLVVVYAARAASTLRDLAPLRAVVGGIEIQVPDEDLVCSALAVAEIYRRDGGWKLRAKIEGVFGGIEDLGTRFGVPVTDRSPPVIGGRSEPGNPGSPSRSRQWSGTGFVVAPNLLITNAHVVEEAASISVASFAGRAIGETVILDCRNDLALVRFNGLEPPTPLVFRLGSGPSLGESAHAFGYPLSGILGSGPQVATGVISGLLGPSDDARILQITTPIQPGSSGGPVLDSSGLLIGVVTATLVVGQNVNFAVRGHLAATLLEAAGHKPELRTAGSDMPLSEIARIARSGVLRLECSR